MKSTRRRMNVIYEDGLSGRAKRSLQL